MSQLHATYSRSYPSHTTVIETSFLPRSIADDYATAMAQNDHAERELTFLLAAVTLCGICMLCIALVR